MVLAHDPATGKSYATDPIHGNYERVVPHVLDLLLFSLSWRKIDPAAFVFDVLIKTAGTTVYLPLRELSYEEVRSVTYGRRK